MTPREKMMAALFLFCAFLLFVIQLWPRLICVQLNVFFLPSVLSVGSKGRLHWHGAVETEGGSWRRGRRGDHWQSRHLRLRADSVGDDDAVNTSSGDARWWWWRWRRLDALWLNRTQRKMSNTLKSVPWMLRSCFKNVNKLDFWLQTPAFPFQRTPSRRVSTRTPTTRSWGRGRRWTQRPWAARTGGWWSFSICARRKTPRRDLRRARSSRL